MSYFELIYGIGFCLFILVLLLSQMPGAITSITGSMKSIMTWVAAQTLTGAATALNQLQFQSAFICQSLYNATGGNTVNAINQGYSKVISVGAASSVSTDLSASFTNIVNASVSGGWIRMKGIQIQVLSVAQDANNGTAASSVTIDNTVANALQAVSHSGWFDNGNEGTTAGSKFTLANGQWMGWGTDNAAGVGVTTASRIIKLTNNDSTTAAAVVLNLVGADA